LARGRVVGGGKGAVDDVAGLVDEGGGKIPRGTADDDAVGGEGGHVAGIEGIGVGVVGVDEVEAGDVKER
jgi:hypothetical protein